MLCFLGKETTKNSLKIPASLQCQIPRQIQSKYSKVFWHAGKAIIFHVNSILGIAPGVAQRIVLFVLLNFQNFESCCENTPRPSESSMNGLFTPRAFLCLKLGVVPRQCSKFSKALNHKASRLDISSVAHTPRYWCSRWLVFQFGHFARPCPRVRLLSPNSRHAHICVAEILTERGRPHKCF